jgi:hypothetical protein
VIHAFRFVTYFQLRSADCFSVPIGACVSQEKLRVRLSSVSATNGNIWVPEEKGFFKRQGVDVSLFP